MSTPWYAFRNQTLVLVDDRTTNWPTAAVEKLCTKNPYAELAAPVTSHVPNCSLRAKNAKEKAWEGIQCLLVCWPVNIAPESCRRWSAEKLVVAIWLRGTTFNVFSINNSFWCKCFTVIVLLPAHVLHSVVWVESTNTQVTLEIVDVCLRGKENPDSWSNCGK